MSKCITTIFICKYPQKCHLLTFSNPGWSRTSLPSSPRLLPLLASSSSEQQPEKIAQPGNLPTWPTNLANQWANSSEQQPETWNCVPRPPWHFWSCLVSEQSILQISHSLSTWISSCFAFTVCPNLSLLPFITFSSKLAIDHLTPLF